MHIKESPFSMNSLYDYLGISKQAHHKAINAQKVWNEKTESLLSLVQEVRKTNPGMGARNIFRVGNPTGIGVNKFERLVIEMGFGIPKKKKSWKTTDSRHHYHKYPNLTHGLKLTDVNQLWVTDITYFMVGKDVFYLIFIMDVYSRRILGQRASNTMQTEYNLEALQESFRIRGQCVFENLIHHSDKGSQYCSHKYIDALWQANCMISMAETSLQNAYAERLNGVIKNQYLDYRPIHDLESLVAYTNLSVEAYNSQKPHSGLLKNMPPIVFEEYIKTMEEKPVIELYNFKSSDLGVFGRDGPNAYEENKKKP